MISIAAHNLGKKFGREWIFRNLSCEITAGEKLVILGGNGSGKSTLLQVLSGFVTANEGEVSYTATADKKSVDTETIKNFISFASPYIQLIDDFTAAELIDHIKLYKPFLSNLPTSQIIEIARLTAAKNKYIRQYSSGMKQRLKLALAILADTPVLLLDEPLSNLDRNGVEWYKEMIATYSENRTIIVCSNAIAEEFSFCTREINVSEHKPAARSF